MIKILKSFFGKKKESEDNVIVPILPESNGLIDPDFIEFLRGVNGSNFKDDIWLPTYANDDLFEQYLRQKNIKIRQEKIKNFLNE